MWRTGSILRERFMERKEARVRLHGEVEYERIVSVGDRSHGYEEPWDYGDSRYGGFAVLDFGSA